MCPQCGRANTLEAAWGGARRTPGTPHRLRFGGNRLRLAGKSVYPSEGGTLATPCCSVAMRHRLELTMDIKGSRRPGHRRQPGPRKIIRRGPPGPRGRRKSMPRRAPSRRALPGKAPDPRVIPVKLDVTSPEDIRRSHPSCTDLTLLINNAGAMLMTPMLKDGSDAALRREMEVNVYGMLAMTRAFAPIPRKERRRRDRQHVVGRELVYRPVQRHLLRDQTRGAGRIRCLENRAQSQRHPGRRRLCRIHRHRDGRRHRSTQNPSTPSCRPRARRCRKPQGPRPRRRRAPKKSGGQRASTPAQLAALQSTPSSIMPPWTVTRRLK